MRNDMIAFPDHSELLAELEVFTSYFTYTAAPDYSLQVAQQSAIHALCLVTQDLSPELIHCLRQPSICYNYDR